MTTMTRKGETVKTPENLRAKNLELAVERKIAMLRHGLSNQDLEKRWGCSKSMVSGLVHGRFRSREKEEDFAKLVGAAWSDLFTKAEVRTRHELPEPHEGRHPSPEG